MAEGKINGRVWHFPTACCVHVLQMSAKVSTLGKGLSAELAAEWSGSSVLAEVISQVAGLFEYRAAAGYHALELQFHPLRFWVSNLDCLVP